MASGWIKCTASDGKTDVYINLANAVSLIAHKTGARITLLGNPDDFIEVMETPEKILDIPVEATNTSGT